MPSIDWKTIAWNGVRFAVPDDWEPSRIEGRHLLFASDTGPVMEVKWGTVKGRFSRQRQLRKLSRRVGRNPSAFRERPLSGGWCSSPAGFETAGFQWEAESERSRGVLLYCATCRTASLIQFFDRPATASVEDIVTRVLGSFRDHRFDGRIAWALYDICAFLPDHFALERHRFEAGRFVLEFKGPRRRLALYRWAPAEVLLQNQGLSAFAATVAGGAALEFRPLTIGGWAGVEGRDPAPAGFGAGLKARLGLSSFRWLRLWHVADRNRILGARLEGRRPICGLEMGAVSDGYGMDDEKACAALADPD